MSDSACDLSASTFSEMSPLTRCDRFSSTRAMAHGDALLVPLRDVGRVVRLCLLPLSGGVDSACTLHFLFAGCSDNEMSDSSCDFSASTFRAARLRRVRYLFGSRNVVTVRRRTRCAGRFWSRSAYFGRRNLGVRATCSLLRAVVARRRTRHGVALPYISRSAVSAHVGHVCYSAQW